MDEFLKEHDDKLQYSDEEKNQDLKKMTEKFKEKWPEAYKLYEKKYNELKGKSMGFRVIRNSALFFLMIGTDVWFNQPNLKSTGNNKKKV